MALDLAELQILVDIRDGIQSLKKMEKGLEDVTTQAKRSADTMDNAFRSAGSAFGSLAKLIGTGTIVAAFNKMVETGAEFQRNLSELSAIIGVTGKDLNFLKETAEEFGRTTTISANDAVTALKLVASAKPDLMENVGALKEVTKQAILLAQASGITLPEAAKTLGLALNQFNADAAEAGRFVNTLAAASKFGSAEIPALAEALVKAGTGASSAGVSFEQAAAAVEVFAKFGVEASVAGTALRNVILKLSVEQDQFNPKVVGLSQALRNLDKANLSSVESLKLFGLENLTFAEQLIKNVDLLDELTRNITGTKVAEEQAATQTNNLVGDQAKLHASWMGLANAIEERLDPQLRSVTQRMNTFVLALTAVSKKTPEMKGFFDNMIEGARMANPMIGAAIDTWSLLIDKIEEAGKKEEAQGSKDTGSPGGRNAHESAARRKREEAEAAREEAGKRESAANAAAAQRKELEELAKGMKGDFVTANQAYAQSLEDMLNLLDAGVITEDQFTTAQIKAFKTLEAATAAETKAVSTKNEYLNSLKAQAESLKQDVLTPYELYKKAMYDVQVLKSHDLITTDQMVRKQQQLEKSLQDTSDAFNQEGRALSDSVATPLERYNKKMEEANLLLSKNAIGVVDLTRLQEKYKRELQDDIDTIEEQGTRGSKAFEDLKNATDGWARHFADSIISNEKGFKGLVDSILKEMERIALTKMFEPLFNGLAKGIGGLAGSGGSSGGGGFLGTIMGLFGMGGGSGQSSMALGQSIAGYGSAFGFGAQEGADFVVPGHGGVDSKMLNIRATPGERFQITPPGVDTGRTSSGGGGVVVHMPIEIINQNGSEIKTMQQGHGQDQKLRIMVRDMVKGELASGAMDSTMSNRFGVNSKGVNI